MRTTLIILLILGTVAVKGQQDPMYSHYLMNPVVLNPAYTGFGKNLSAIVGYRKQWAGFNGSPSSFYATGHSSFLGNRVGVGLMVMQDNIGTESTATVQALYAYHIAFRSDARLSFGLQGGMVNYTNDFDKLTVDRADPGFQRNVSVIKPTIGAGIIFSTDKLYAGLSVPRLLKTTVEAGEDELTYYSQHAYLMLAYVTPLSYNVKIKPFAVARMVRNTDPSVDAGLAIKANNAYTIGAFTRNLHSVGLLAAMELGDKLRFGYVLEVPGKKSIGTRFTSHEITLGFRLKVFRYHDINAVTDL
jgi:type IX secretion system PorP/SprF family membrane protein